MQLKKRSRTFLTLLTLISFTTTAYAQESQGRYTQLLEGQPAPFAGWCFDDKATGQIFSKLKFSEQQCNLRLENELKKQETEHSLKVGNLNLRINTLQEKHKELLAIKDIEIQNLETAALKRPNDYSIWWATGGFFAGAATVVAILLAIK